MYIDISRKINGKLPVYSGDPQFKFKKVCSVEKDGFNVHEITMGSHFSTHIDFPKHFFENGKCAADYSAEDLCMEAYTFEVNGQELNKEFFEKRKIEENTAVMLKFNGKPYGIKADAAQCLAEKKIKMIVTEGMDIEESENFEVHKILLKNNVLIMEYADLSRIKEGKSRLYAFSLAIKGCDGSPVRAVVEVI